MRSATSARAFTWSATSMRRDFPVTERETTMRVVRLALIASLLLWMLPVAESLAAGSAPELFDAPANIGGARSGISSRAAVRQRPAAARLGLLTHPDGSPAL